MGRALVIGYGNELRADDGAGFVLAQGLANDPRLAEADVLARRQLTPELALDASRASRLILVDASRELKPGDVLVRRLPPSGERASSWSHHMTPEALIRLAEELYSASPPTFVVSLGIASLDVEQRLSTEVEAALPRAADEVARLAAETTDA